MKFLIVFVALFALALAAPAEVQNLRLASEVGPESYKFGYENSDGASHDEQGVVKNLGADNEGISVTGSYKFIGDDGVIYEVTYIADENGFQPQGAHLPVAPSV
ncbi:larval cuticle protein 65Ag1-like [Drosophila nasuta]|uniref:larval cuticle protein 65Ag1-like n=1 Tax=Drosophila nasuta TaxID=42062 RepID=UPI00295EF990|nr:larval cuticle protein 65Ag1-like [Drosophila nasuta]